MARRASPGLSEGRLNLFGPQLQKFRTERGWTQLQLIIRLKRKGWNINPATLAFIENGKRSLADHELVFLLKVLGRKLADLEE